MADRRFLGVRRGLFFLVGTSKTKSSHRLQRDLGRERRCKAQVKKRSRLGPQGSIFGQIAAGLTHQPYGGCRTSPLCESRQKFLFPTF
jgi:hypothetical protein